MIIIIIRLLLVIVRTKQHREDLGIQEVKLNHPPQHREPGQTTLEG